MSRPCLINICGPTAIGKTALAIALAKHYQTEIIAADSRQFYREMNIGTAVPSIKELTTIKHHFIQHKSIFDQYNIGNFERDAINLLGTLFERHKTVIMVGGSGLYTDAVLYGLDDLPETLPTVRKHLNNILEVKGLEDLQKQLKILDSDYYQSADIQNPRRVIRALEICISSKKPYSSFLNRQQTQRDFRAISIVLHADRAVLYRRINSRVDKMITDGLEEEAKRLYPYKDKNALQTVGYREWSDYFKGHIGLDKVIEEIKKNSRRYAKRQMTWLRRKENLLWQDYQTPVAEIIKAIRAHREDR